MWRSSFEEGETFYGSMIRFQSFRKHMPLDCELHKSLSVCFFVFSLSKGGTQWLQLAKVGIFLLPGQLTSDKIESI